jgi:hypothetical protein
MRLIKPRAPLVVDLISVKASAAPVCQKMMLMSMSHVMCRTPGSSGVALREQMATFGVVVAAWCCCRLLMYVNLELLIAEEEADLLSQWCKCWIHRLRSVIAAAVAAFAVELVGDGRVVGSGRGGSVVAAAVHVVATRWQDSRF